MEQTQNHEKILSLILDQNEITWQTIIYDLINSEQMDPWDIDVSLLTQKYIDRIKSLKEHDFRLSGKVLLAAAILLKIKSNKWLKEDIANLDAMFSSTEEDADDLFAGFDNDFQPREKIEADLIPRTPQPRRRKVSIYDLVNALEQALEVKHRRILRDMPILDVKIPVKKRDISEIIKEVYLKISSFFQLNSKNRLTFSKLLSSDKKEDKIYTFIPLLHLSNQQKITLEQYQHFGEIEIMLKQQKELAQELGSE